MGLDERKIPDYSLKAVSALGLVQLAGAAITLGLEVTGLIHGAIPYSTGIWAAVIFAISGGLTLGSRNGSRCLIIATMVMTILSCMVSVIVAVMSCVVMEDNTFMLRWRRFDVSPIYAILLVTGLIMLVTCTLASVLACRATCCRQDSAYLSTMSKESGTGSGGPPVYNKA